MTQDEIIKLAQEAASVYATETWTFNLAVNQLAHFAALVAAAEREACAKVCEDASTPVAGEILTDGQWASKILAGKIRARGNL